MSELAEAKASAIVKVIVFSNDLFPTVAIASAHLIAPISRMSL